MSPRFKFAKAKMQKLQNSTRTNKQKNNGLHLITAHYNYPLTRFAFLQNLHLLF